MPATPEQEQPAIEPRIQDPSELKRLDKERNELKGYLDAVEHEKAREPVQDDSTGQVLLTPQPQSSVQVVLPLTEAEIKRGLHHKIVDAMRWLAEWCVRMAKKQWTQSQP